MGTSHSSAEFSRKIVKAATATQQRAKMSVEQGALTAKTIVLAEASSKGLTPGSKIAGSKWGVRYDIKGFNNPTALLKVTGAFHLVEGDTKPHFIAARGLGGTRRSRSQRAQAAALVSVFGLSGKGAFAGSGQSRGRKGAHALRLGDGEYAAYSRHPGTKGKGVWKAAKPKIQRAVPAVMAQRIIGGWREVFR